MIEVKPVDKTAELKEKFNRTVMAEVRRFDKHCKGYQEFQELLDKEIARNNELDKKLHQRMYK